jgi:transposase
MARKPYPSDVTDEEWDFVVPYLTLMTEDAPQREHDLREVFNAMRWVVRTGSPWRYMPNDLPPWENSDAPKPVLAELALRLHGGIVPRISRATPRFPQSPKTWSLNPASIAGVTRNVW